MTNSHAPPRAWETIELRRLVNVIGGLTPSKNDESFWDGDVFWVSPKDMKVPLLYDSEDRVTERALEKTGLPRIAPGAVLLVVRGMILAHTVPVAINMVPVTLNQDMKALIARTRLSSRYLAWFLLGSQRKLLECVEVAGHGTCALRSDEWGKLRITVPPIDEQTQIAKFLDYETARIDALVEKQQQLIELLKEKRQAVISHAVTKGLNPDAPMRDSGVEWLGKVPAHWEVCRLKHTSQVIDCRNKTPEYTDDGEYFVVRTTNVKNQQLQVGDDTLRTDQRNFDIWTQRGVPPAGSIFTREAPTGEVCLVPPDVKLCMGQRMMNFVPFNPAYTSFLFAYLMSDCMTRYIGSVSCGSTVSHLRVDQVENIPVVVPPQSEAVGVASYVTSIREKMEQIVRTCEAQVAVLSERRSALISAAVTGKIDVRNWKPPADHVTTEIA